MSQLVLAKCASAGYNVSVSTAPAAIDDVTPNLGDRVLLKEQTAPAENGVWIYKGGGVAMLRDPLTEHIDGLSVRVAQGSGAGQTGLTGNATTDILTLNNHGFVADQPIIFTGLTGGAGLSNATTYYARTITQNTFQVATAPGGAAINFTTNVTAGTVQMSPVWPAGNADTDWRMVASDPITLNATALYFTRSNPSYLPGGPVRSPWNPTAPPAVIYEADRRSMFTSTKALVTATLYFIGPFTLAAGVPLTGVRLWATVAGTVTGRHVGLADANRLILAMSANAGSAFNANAKTDQAFSAPYTPPKDIVGAYVVLGLVASVTPTLIASAAGDATFLGQVPILCGTSSTAATTTPPTVGSTPGALTALTQSLYAAIY